VLARTVVSHVKPHKNKQNAQVQERTPSFSAESVAFEDRGPVNGAVVFAYAYMASALASMSVVPVELPAPCRKDPTTIDDSASAAAECAATSAAGASGLEKVHSGATGMG
jgi:hypothetical protein